MSDLTIRFEQAIESRPEIQPVPGDPFIKPATLEFINELTSRAVRAEAANDRLVLEKTRLLAQLAEFDCKRPTGYEFAVSVLVPFISRPVMVHFEPPGRGKSVTPDDITRVDHCGDDISYPMRGLGLETIAEIVNAELAAQRRADEESRAESILATMGEPIV